MRLPVVPSLIQAVSLSFKSRLSIRNFTHCRNARLTIESILSLYMVESSKFRGAGGKGGQIPYDRDSITLILIRHTGGY